MKALISAALIISLASLSTAASAQYRWLDADGKVTYGDAPPPTAHDIQRLGSNGTSRSETSDPALPYELRLAVERFPVTLYTSANCTPCEQARSFLRNRGVPYTEKTVRFKEELEQMQRTGLGNTFPAATIGRTTKKGFLAADWTAELNAAGYPEQSKLPAQWKPAAPQPLIEPPKPGNVGSGNTESNEPPPPPEPTVKQPFGGASPAPGSTR